MIIDIHTGLELIPGNHGKDCPGNGENGDEICCDECNYLCCCFELLRKHDCTECISVECPRNENERAKEKVRNNEMIYL